MKKEKVKKPENKKKPLTKKQKEVLFGVATFSGSFVLTTMIILTFAVFIPQANVNKAEKDYQNAVSLLDKGDYDVAASLFKNMTYGDSKNLYYVAEAGQCFEKGDYESGIERIHDAGGSADVKYDANGGTTSKSREVLNAKRKWINNIPIKHGYEFIDWELSSFALHHGSNRYVADVNLLASWNIVNYSITYDLNGGSLDNLVNDYNAETPTFSLGTPVKRGYTFIGWSGTDINGTSFNVSINEGSVGNRNYVANYEANQYTITYDLKYDNLSNNQDVIFDSDYSLFEPSRDGYRFDGWYYNGQKLTSGKWNIDSDVTLIAQWSMLTYNINYNLNGGINNPNNPEKITYFGVVLLMDPEKEGYIFDGWYMDDIKVDRIVEGTTSDITLEARWIALKNEFAVYSEDLAHGTVSITYGTGYSGEEMLVKATPEEGYTFLGWYDGETVVSCSLDYSFNMPPHDYSLVARFIPTSQIDYATTPYLDGVGATYGLYPQTHVNDRSLIGRLAAVSYRMANGWVKYNNNYYYGPISSANSGTFDDGTEFEAGSEYWFKCEPIEWLTYIDYDKANVYFTTKKLLDVIYSDKDDNFYENSIMRSWLYTDFYNTAFYLDDKYILETEILNISERIWIGQRLDYTRLGDPKRAYLTDYARIRGNINWVEGTIDDDPSVKYFAPYLARPVTATSILNECVYIDFDGSNKYVYTPAYFGVRPCVNIMFTRDNGDLNKG